MPTSIQEAVSTYLRTGDRAQGTRAAYRTTIKKWEQWGHSIGVEHLRRREIRDFLDWVYERSVAQKGIGAKMRRVG